MIVPNIPCDVCLIFVCPSSSYGMPLLHRLDFPEMYNDIPRLGLDLRKEHDGISGFFGNRNAKFFGKDA